MKVPLSWLKKYLPFALNPETVADFLTLSGLEVEKIDNGEDDLVFTVALTPDLGHCRSILGIARELAPHLHETIRHPKVNLKEDPDNNVSSKITISNEDFEACPHYCVRMLQGVEVGPSPAWLVNALKDAGYQSVNNVVDITNFVMLETGQPLHAFDYDKIRHKSLVIRKASKEEALETLDGIERTIPEGTLLIYDQKTPLAIAGVLGGLESGIHTSTHTIVLEAAQFSPSIVRKGSKKLGIRTESSARFEYGIDPAGIKNALNRATSLIAECAGGRVLKGTLEQSLKPYMPRFISIGLTKINKILGLRISFSEIESLFTRLSFSFTSDGLDLFHVKVPSYRNDLQSEVDLISEVAKLYGLNNIERSPHRTFHANTPDHPLYLFEKETRHRLVSMGLQEFITCDLISPLLASLEIAKGNKEKEYAAVLHAKSIDQSILRISLLPSLLEVVKHNQNQKTFDIAGFELGNVHFKRGSGFEERLVLGIILTGQRAPSYYDQKPPAFDFYSLKGIVETLQKSLLLPPFTCNNKELKAFHPHRQISLSYEDDVMGVLGEVHPETLSALDIKGRVFFAELDIEDLQKRKKALASFTPLPEFPSSERDLTLSLPLDKDAEELFTLIEKTSSPLLKKTTLLDIYTGAGVPLGEKRITLRFTYRDDKKTVDHESVEKEHAKIVSLLIS